MLLKRVLNCKRRYCQWFSSFGDKFYTWLSSISSSSTVGTNILISNGHRHFLFFGRLSLFILWASHIKHHCLFFDCYCFNSLADFFMFQVYGAKYRKYLSISNSCPNSHRLFHHFIFHHKVFYQGFYVFHWST
jgi:hypothetical protein